MEGEAVANSWFFLYGSAFLGSCLFGVLVLYNIVGAIGFMREDTGGESSSALAKAAWLVGLASFLLGPCAWMGAVLAIVLARVERGRIYEEKASLAGATPCRMASVNGGVTLLLWAMLTAGMVATYLQQG